MVDTVDITKDYIIDRKTAAERLNLSVRTVDRHVKQGKLSSHQRDGRIWLSKKEIEKKTSPSKVDSVDTVMSIDTEVSSLPQDVDMVSTVSTSKPQEKIFEKLYEELREEFRHQQDRLEHANYRVGQLEAQIQNTVPLLEFNREKSLYKEDKEALSSELTTLQDRLKNEKLTKALYLAILFVILILQPVWLWLSVVK